MKKMKGLLLAVLLISLALGGFTMQTATAATYADTSEYPSLRELYQDYFRIGVAVQAIDHWNDPTAEIGNPAKEELIRNSFNSMTFGNEFKPAYNFDPESPTLFTVDRAAEELLTWAKENGMPVRGHVLVWHSQVNPAIFAKDYKALSGGKETRSDSAELDADCLVDRDTLIARLRTYIYGLLEYTYANGFADVIYAWDVVNEATDEGFEDGLRRSYWYRIIGPEFLYYSFLFAREAVLAYSEQYAAEYGLDPETDDLSAIRPLLFYNDYNEWYENRCTNIIRFLTGDAYNAGGQLAQSPAIAADGDGTIFGDGLVDGIGMQGHLDDTQNIDQYMRALERYSDAVGLVHITELDVGETASGDLAEYNQAKFYYDFFSRLMEEKEKGYNLTSVTFWGLTDDASWRRGANPLLFYGDLGRKPAFTALEQAAAGQPFSLQQVRSASAKDSLTIDFEPYKENGETKTVPPASVGFMSRGAGHQSALVLVNKENHTEGAAIGFCLRVQRKEQDASVKLNISQFTGCELDITLYVKTADSEIVLGLDGKEGQELLRAASDGEWTELHTSCSVPEAWKSAALYVETDGSSDIFIDDVRIDVLNADDPAGDSGDTENGKDENSSAAANTKDGDTATENAEETDSAAENAGRATTGRAVTGSYTEGIEIPEISLPAKQIPDTEALRFARNLGPGWNLGNTMDATAWEKRADDTWTETAWQPVKTTREAIHGIREAGFRTMRIPVSWHDHLTDDDYTISEAWLDRVQEIADYALEEGMYVILNIHHDNDRNLNCLYPDSAHMEQSERFIRRIWEQVAERFADYDEHLIFEAMNEPRLTGHAFEWNPDTSNADVADAFDCINHLNRLFVETVRGAGENNAKRWLMVPAYDASPWAAADKAFTVPEDPGAGDGESRIMVSAHAYTPYDFALNKGGTDRFAGSGDPGAKDIADFMDALYKRFISNGTPVVIGEFGAMDKRGNLQDRVRFTAYYTACAAAHGLPCLWWDNGAFAGDGEIFGIYDRNTCEFRYPEIAGAMLKYGLPDERED